MNPSEKKAKSGSSVVAGLSILWPWLAVAGALLVYGMGKLCSGMSGPETAE